MSLKRKIEEVGAEFKVVVKKKRLESGSKLDVEFADQDPCSFSSLPLEIISQHILQFFDFIEWLEFVIVSKQWLLAARQSRLHKQFVIVSQQSTEIACSIIARYRVNTLIVDAYLQMKNLQEMLSASASVTTLVFKKDLHLVNNLTSDHSCFNQIQTLSLHNMEKIGLFPNVIRLQLVDKLTQHTRFDPFMANLRTTIRHTSVQELEFSVDTIFNNYAAVKEWFPSAMKWYINCECSNTKAATEAQWKRLESIGDSLGVQVICRNPHLSKCDNVFNLTSLSYHEYFNAFGETPLQRFLGLGKTELCTALFTKYTSKEYERDLYCREPHFNFPLRSYEFTLKVQKTIKHTLSVEVMLAMIECRYLNYWRALGYDKMTYNKQAIETLLPKAKQYLPASRIAVESLATVSRVQSLSYTDIAKMMGLAVFKRIARLRSKMKGDTLLHDLAQRDSYEQSDYELLKHCKINGLNNLRNNAATAAFNYGNFKGWRQLVRDGATIQTERYAKEASITLLVKITQRRSDVPEDTLQLFNQVYLQRLMRLLVGEAMTKRSNGISEGAAALLEDLIQRGAVPKDKGSRSPLICKMAKSCSIILFWPIIEKYALDLDEASVHGFTPLMLSIKKGSFQQASYLLEKGANPNAVGKSYTGELKCAVLMTELATGGHQFVELLHNYGADFAVEDKLGNTALNNVVANCTHADIAPLAKYVPINKPNHNNFTPLSCAITRQSCSIIQALVAAGANVNVQAGPFNQPPLLMAIDTLNNYAICQLLSVASMNITLRDKGGRSLVHYLLQIEDEMKIKSVLDYHLTSTVIRNRYSDEDSVNFVRQELAEIFSTPQLSAMQTRFLRLAIQSLTMTEVVINVLKIDINQQDLNGDTMLTLVDINTPPLVVDFLLAHGANVNHQNKEKNTLLMKITDKNRVGDRYKSLQMKLIGAGASLFVKNIWDLSPLDIEPQLVTFVILDCVWNIF